MIKFNVEARKRAIRDILVDLKGKLDDSSCGSYSTEFHEDAEWTGNEFKFVFNILLSTHAQSLEYDAYVEASDFARRLIIYLINSDSADITLVENACGLEIEIVGKTNHD